MANRDEATKTSKAQPAPRAKEASPQDAALEGQTLQIMPTDDAEAQSNSRGRPSDVTRPEGVVCQSCMSIVETDHNKCPHCGTRRPRKGWTPLESCGDEWLGCVIDDTYIVIRLLGQGGMGRVYEAESMTVARSFALKIVDPGQADVAGHSEESVRDRLEREIEAQSTLRNPHIVPLFDALDLPENRVAIVMDYIEGETVRELVYREGPLPLERACAITRQIANGLQEAHDAGMIHRDLKPSNIMVEVLPAGDQFVHVFDFGVVSISGDASRTQGFVGTPLYASPEQACGDELDARSDIYSLGAVLFCMLTGRPPFAFEELFEALNAHVNEPAPTLNEALHERVFPDRLEDLVARLLAKEPSNRPSSMAQLISELDALSKIVGKEASLSEESYSSLAERSNAATIVPESAESMPLVEVDPVEVDPVEVDPVEVDPVEDGPADDGPADDDTARPAPGAQILFTPDESP
jgi:serine/threonine protein kinase